MVYTIEQIKEKILPIIEKYEIKVVYIFGSYARGDATIDSDVDILFRLKGSRVIGLIYGVLIDEIQDTLNKKVDLVTEESLYDVEEMKRSPWFIKSIFEERVKIYEKN